MLQIENLCNCMLWQSSSKLPDLCYVRDVVGSRKAVVKWNLPLAVMRA